MAVLVSNTIQFLFLSSMLSILLWPTNAQSLGSLCTPSANSISNSTYQNNVALLLNSLQSNLSNTGYYNATEGENPNRVYGLGQCVDSSGTCASCIGLAIQQAFHDCPNSAGGIQWQDECLLRYSNTSFFSVVDSVTRFREYDRYGRNVSDPDQFRPFLKDVMSNLSSKAAFNTSGSFYATGNASFTSNETVHGVVQCTRDLSANDCNKCLKDVIEGTTDCCYFSASMKALSGSCNLLYEVAAPSSASTAKPTYSLVFALLMVLILLP